ncbi:MAG: translation initiation factor IF-2 [bacterium]
MKIPELAKKLEITPADLRKYASDLGYNIGHKSRTIKDSVALKLDEKIKELLEQKKVERLKKDQANIKKKDQSEAGPPQAEKIEIPPILTVKNFASLIQKPVTVVIKELMKNGIMATINENIDYDTAAIIADELEIKVVRSKNKEAQTSSENIDKTKLSIRPPVVVVMGHVDHGKTALLDKIRESNVAASESGGITQHIGAYQVNAKTKEGKTRLITFIDTPGHEAFTAMRAHGASITDIVILVVAADDGVKPQTREAIEHANAAGVPIIVAINKIDLPGSDTEKVKKELASLELNPEDWGGTTPMVPISAKTGKGIDELLEVVLLSVDLEELKAVSEGLAQGVVIESFLDQKSGPIASVLVQSGKLTSKDTIVVKDTWGRILKMTNFQGDKIQEAGPSTPVRILGLNHVPDFGSKMTAVSDEKTAKMTILNIKRVNAAKTIGSGGLAEVSKNIKSGTLKDLNIIIKADVAGSIAALKNSLEAMGNKEVGVKIISASVGNISESDVMLAEASNAIILGFKVQASPTARKLSQTNNIDIHNYSIIYDLLDEVKAALSGMLESEKVEVEIARGKILKIFSWTKNNKIIGVKVLSGEIQKGLKFYEKQGDKKIGSGKILSLKIGKEVVDNASEGKECGLGIEFNQKLQIDSKLIFYKIEERLRKL